MTSLFQRAIDVKTIIIVHVFIQSKSYTKIVSAFYVLIIDIGKRHEKKTVIMLLDLKSKS